MINKRNYLEPLGLLSFLIAVEQINLFYLVAAACKLCSLREADNIRN